MARKKPSRTRMQEFKARRRNSWLSFFGKVTLFAVPVIGLTVWLVLSLLRTGHTLPVLTLNFGPSQATRAQPNTWERIDYSCNKETGIIFTPETAKTLKFGGPQNDTLFIFNDLLGSAKPVGEGGQSIACVFVPSTEEEHSTHGFRGLRSEDTHAEKNQWIPFEDYIQKMVDAVSDTAKLKKDRGKIVIVLDVDHPDLPAHLPPQANQFVRLCKQQWNTECKNINANHDVFVWLSHSEGQMSYYHSDFSKVETFFKRRFDLAISGAVVDIQGREQPNGDICYSDLKMYMKKWVESDSNVHKLAQTPTFLEPAGAVESGTSFPILRFEDTSSRTTLFDYVSRKPNNVIRDHWNEFESTKVSQAWTLENPLLVQRSTMLLLQLEKLWYVGKDDSELFGDLEDELDSLLKTTVTIAPIQHSLYDAQANAPGTEFRTLEMNWLIPQPPKPTAPAPEGQSTENAAPSTQTPDELEQERTAKIEGWKNKYPNWSGAMGVWQTFKENQPSRLALVAALELLSNAQKFVQRPESASEIESLSNTHWNEIGFLERLANELAWPTEQNSVARFQQLVGLSIKARDEANRLQSELTPVLCLKFSDKLASLENRRRTYEDQMFAMDHTELAASFEGLISEYKELSVKHRALKAEFELIQQELISAPHDVRYCLESLAVLAQNGDDETQRELLIEDFGKWINDDNGMMAGWIGLGSQMIGALTDIGGDVDKRTSSFDIVRRGGFSSRGPANDSIKGFASNPYLDLIDFNSLNTDIGSADGNLLARRLLVWPGLDTGVRNNIRDGLCKLRVEEAGNIDETTEAQKTLDFENPNIANRLAAVFDNEQLQLLLARSDEPIPFVQGVESFFIRVAYGAHRLLVQRDDLTADNLVVAINGFRSEKSNLDFERVASDLWATPQSSRGTAFVTAVLKNHNNVIDSRIQKIPVLDSIKTKITEVWNSGAKQQWAPRIVEVETFCDNFQVHRWEWMKDAQRAVNNKIALSIEKEKQRDNRLLFALSPDALDFDKTLPGTFDNEKNWLDHEDVRGDSLRVYLRGHQAVFKMSRRPPDPKSIAFEVNSVSSNTRGAQLIVKRVNDGPVSGHISLVIDCSRSMGATGMKRAKDDVVEFLQQISKRGDISVSLVAIGASETWNFDEQKWDERKRSELPSWNRDEESDVWVYEGTGRVVDERTLPSLQKAIGELKEFGETPILAGLDKALSLTQGVALQAKLVVLLTDGFEFGNRERKAGEKYAPLNLELFNRVGQQLDAGAELVVFSQLMTADLGVAFKGMIDSGFPKAEISRRISMIESLATKVEKANETSLQEFFKGLLPQPRIFASGNGNPKLDRKEKVEDGVDLNKDKDLSDAERKIMAAIELNSNVRPDRWSVGVSFDQTDISNAANSFAKKPLDWTCETKLQGNEKLEFAYDPFRPDFNLTTASITDVNAKEVELKGHTLEIGRTSQRRRMPAFEIASKDSTKLTPAPAIAFLTLQQNNDLNRTLLMQDFNLLQQQKSNVHPLEFPALDQQHLDAAFKGNRVDLQLNLIKDFTPQFWAKIEFGGQEDPWKVTNKGGLELTIKPNDYGSLAELLPETVEFSEYRIEIRRDNTNPDSDYDDYWIRIEPNVETKPVDRWLVQVLGADGQIDRAIKQKSQKRYVFRENSDGTKQLIHVEHHFTIIRRELQKSKAYFGFANIDHLTDIEIGKVEYPDYFRE